MAVKLRKSHSFFCFSVACWDTLCHAFFGKERRARGRLQVRKAHVLSHLLINSHPKGCCHGKALEEEEGYEEEEGDVIQLTRVRNQSVST
jgi:hypothetical protein